MFLGGVWHGANYTFIFWGIIHGVGIIINHLTKNYFIKIPNFISIILTFIFVNLAWVMFRANSVSDALIIYKNMINLNSFDMKEINISILFIFLLMMVVFFTPNSQTIIKFFQKNVLNSIIISFLLVANLISINLYSPFIYFAF